MALHKDLTGADLHEPKGISGASSGEVYVADGAGSGSWQELVIPEGTFVVTTTKFTASGTWTKPANIFMAEVIVVGGGGGSRGQSSNGGAGGTSSFGSHVSASGGGFGTNTSGGTGGSTFTNSGDVNYPGTFGVTYNGSGAASGLDYIKGGQPGLHLGNSNSVLYGEGGYVTVQGITSVFGTGGGGAASEKRIPAVSLGATETVTVGAAGAAGSGGSGNAGGPGVVIVKEFIKVV